MTTREAEFSAWLREKRTTEEVVHRLETDDEFFDYAIDLLRRVHEVPSESESVS